MLQRQTFQEPQAEGDFSQPLTPAYFYEVLKRRARYFFIPLLLVFTIGALVTAIWPAIYVSQGTILVQSQEIPSDLVRPTIAALANDRIQIIEQRIMTRDNLLAIAKKYRLTTGWLERVSGTEVVDFIKKRTVIKPAEQKIEAQKKQSIAFTVGFEYEKPDIATKVANELVTMILNEDVRSRTEFAAETSRFLAQEVTRLESRLASIDAQIIALKTSRIGNLSETSPLDNAKDLASLKAQLLIKSATYSDTHPDILALKRKIAALEKLVANSPSVPTDLDANGPATSGSPKVTTPGIDTLVSQRDSLKDELNKASQKLSAARLGESLEKGKHSERLEVIEQPSLPQQPIRPNRPKIFLVVCFLALMSSGGAVFAAEMLNQSVRRSADLASLIDSHLIVSIPYITTHAEVRRKKIKTIMTTGILTTIVVVGLIVLYFVLPPLDILFDKVITLLTR